MSARIFSEGDYLAGTLTWGWQCFGCRTEDTGFATATAAQESCDIHAEFCGRWTS